MALLVAAGCGGGGSHGGFFASSATAPTTSRTTPAPITSATKPPKPPKPPAPVTTTTTTAPVKSYDGTGTVALVGTTKAVVFTNASGKKWELEGPRVKELSTKLALGKADEAKGWPVRVRGHTSTATTQTSGATSVELVEFSFTTALTNKTVATGAVLRQKSFTSLYASKQNLCVFEADPSKKNIGLRLGRTSSTAGEITSSIAKRLNAEAAINASFFEFAQHTPTGFFKVADKILFPNGSGRARSTFGLDVRGDPLLMTLAPGDKWTVARDALGAGPGLVTGGTAKVATAEGFGATFASDRHPRSAIGIKPSGVVVLVAVDGRTTHGAGMSLPELARVMVLLGCDKAMNLDGGGSTALYVKGQGTKGVVNHPSDPGGERLVSTAILIDW
ncbi:MAG: phosphodiester glycosidase family protein [Planctomycetota bacterium]